MTDTGIPDDMLLPLAAGLGAALCFMLVFFALRRRSDSRDQTLAPNATPEDPANPPGWVTSDSPPPPAAAPPPKKPPPEKLNMFEVIRSAHALLTPEVVDRAKQMRSQGASIDDILAAVLDGPAGAGDGNRDILRAAMENIFSSKQMMTPGASGVSFRANVSVNTGSVHESFQMDTDSFARARAMIDQGSSVDDICRAVNPEYGSWEADHQKRFQQMMTTLLRMGGVAREKLT